MGSPWRSLERSTREPDVFLKLMERPVKTLQKPWLFSCLKYSEFLGEVSGISGRRSWTSLWRPSKESWGSCGGPWEVIGALQVCSGQHAVFWDWVPPRRGGPVPPPWEPGIPSLGARYPPWVPFSTPLVARSLPLGVIELSGRPLGVHWESLEILGKVNGRSRGVFEAQRGAYKIIKTTIVFMF